MSYQLCQPNHFDIGKASASSGYSLFYPYTKGILLIIETVLLYYDYFLTLSREVDRFWHSGPHTWASIVFFANRYIAVLGHVPFLYIVYADPCNTVHIRPFLAQYHGVLMLLLHSLTSVLLVMRVYALYFRNKWVLAFLALEAVGAMSVGCWVLIWPGGGASADLQKSIINDRFRTAVAFSGLLVFDFSVFTLSTYRSIKLGRHNEPFLKRLFMDGFVYYGVTWSGNLVNVIVLVAADPSVDLATPVFANILSVIMVSRLMINLHDPMLHESTVRGDTDETGTSSRTGYISTFAPDVILFALETQAESGMELSTLDLGQENAPGSMPHGAL